MIIIDGFKKCYKQSTIIMNYAIFNQKICLLEGQNGSGKTTILKAIAKLINYEGTIKTTGDVLYVEENAQFPPDMRVIDYLKGLDKIKPNNVLRIEQLLKQFSLENNIKSSFKQLSKGMRQKINLIQALSSGCEILLLDEPLSGLDPTMRALVADLLIEYHGMCLCATHQTDIFSSLNVARYSL